MLTARAYVLSTLLYKWTNEACARRVKLKSGIAPEPVQCNRGILTDAM